jgi:glycosyltransferase involved in cell wall biosynthesis
MRINFIWQGIDGRYGHWKDGLWRAMKHLEEKYEVKYFEPTDDIPEEGIVFYWEAPCTINSKDAENYKKVMNLPNKKVLLFAGGPIKKEWVEGFDLVCVESKINAEEFTNIGVKNITAFGINEDIFFPQEIDKLYDGIHQGTCASWKRQWLVGESIGDKGIVVGRFQDSDPYPFKRCEELGTTVLPEQPYEKIAELLNQSLCLLQTSDFWGGGQRATLEAMACNIPVVCMEDSPKNREYVEESGLGLVVPPDPQHIKMAVEEIRNWDKKSGRDYVMSKWTSKHYASKLKEAINICQQHQRTIGNIQ